MPSSRHHTVAGTAARAAALTLLGLPAHATEADIVHAYRRLARATHPDTSDRTDPAAGHGFARVHDAYQLLIDQQRAEHHADDPPPDAANAPPAAWPRPAPPPARTTNIYGRPPIVAGPVTVTAPTPNHRANPRKPA
jgi:hypothetical protein